MDNRLEQIIKQCRVLLNHPNAEYHRNYLDNRISHVMQERFIFGYFPGSKDIHLLSDVIGMDALKELGLIYNWDFEDSLGPRTMYVNYFEEQSLVMSYKDVYGRVVALVGRSLLSDKEREDKGIEKYKNTKFTKGNHLFGLNDARQHIIRNNCVYIVEGQFDVIKAFEKGLMNIVGIGSANMSDYQFTLLCRFTNNIKLLLDNDVAGEKGRRAIKEKYGSFANIQDVHLPSPYKDIDEYLKDNSAQSIEFLTSME